MTIEKNFEVSFANFLTKLQAMRAAYYQKTFSNLTVPTLEIKRGSKFLRVFSNNGTQSHCYCFVELATGDIYKPATYKAPAKHARGNIYGEDPLQGCNPHGIEYLNR